MTLPEATGQSATQKLDMDPLDAEIRQVYFLDTPDLLLNKNGLVVRARRRQGGADDSVVKLRPVVPSELPEHLRKIPEFGVEVDAMPGGWVCSASFKGELGHMDVKEAAAGERSVKKLFSKGQRDFFADYAPEGVEIDGLTMLGPLTVFKLKCEPTGFGRRLVGEMWMYHDGTRVLELSTKCKPTEGFQVAAELKALLSDRKVELAEEQATKTATALKFFAEELKQA